MENDNKFGYEKITILVDNIPLNKKITCKMSYKDYMLSVIQRLHVKCNTKITCKVKYRDYM
jgi:hypothetical protein